MYVHCMYVCMYDCMYVCVCTMYTYTVTKPNVKSCKTSHTKLLINEST